MRDREDFGELSRALHVEMASGELKQKGRDMKTFMLSSVFVSLCLAAGPGGAAREADRYDFRATPAYAALTEQQRNQLMQVRRDFAALWGALDMYADEHGGQTPETLSDLVPQYLPELPRDPFATEQTANAKDLHGAKASLNGWGYRYRRGAASNRAWYISSVGLPDFPFLAARGNVGLYVCKGTWISGINPVVKKAN